MATIVWLFVLYLYNVISFLYHRVNCHLGPLWLQLYGCLSSTYIMSLVSYTTGLTVIWGLYGYNCMAVWLSSTYIMSLVSYTTRLTVIWGPLWLQLYGCLIVLYLYNVISFLYHRVNCHLGPLWLQLYGCLSSTYIMSLVSYTTRLTVIWGLYGYNCMAVCPLPI